MDGRMQPLNVAVGLKRKFTTDGSGSDDDEEESKSLKLDPRDQTKKQNHSEIEKRRRDKMNKYITELSTLVPMCKYMSRKLDKLTVLRMAVQHMKTLRGSINSYVEGHYKPSFLSDEELKHLILQAADGFLFVVSCDRARILFVSESVSNILNYAKTDLLGQSLFDILHPKDIAKVKEQLSPSTLSPNERLVDAKTMLPVKSDVPQIKKLCPGTRRSFFCRMKCKTVSVKEEMEGSITFQKRCKAHVSDRHYCVVHCTGYLKSWSSANFNMEGENEVDTDYNLSCLVAIGQVQQELCDPSLHASNVELQPIEFNSRHSMDGKFLFVDQRVTLVLGYIPQDLLGTSCYEYVHQNDIAHIADIQRQVLQSKEAITTRVYKFRTKDNTFRYLQSKWKIFRNPWTKDFEYIVSVNTLIPTPEIRVNECSSSMSNRNYNSNNFDSAFTYIPSSENVGEASQVLGMHVGAGKIGCQIADEVLKMQQIRNTTTACSPVSVVDNVFTPLQTVAPGNKEEQANLNFSVQEDVTSNNPHENSEFSNGSSQINNTIQYPTNVHPPLRVNPELEMMDSLMGREMIHASYQHNSNSDGNDEAAMAVIMSLLEADAGLGGPVDFSGLPWPLH